MPFIDTRAALLNGSDPIGDWVVNNQERERLHNSRTAQKAREQGVDIDIAMEADAPVMPPTDNKAQEIDDSFLLGNTELDTSDFAPPLAEQKGYVWNHASQTLHDWHFKVGEYEEDKTGKYFNKNWLAQNPKEVSQFGLELGGAYMYSDMANVQLLSQLIDGDDELPDQVAMARLILLGEYDKLPSGTWAGTFRMMRHMVANPTSFGTLGSLSAIRNLAVRGGKRAVVDGFRRRYWNKLMDRAGVAGRATLKYGTVPTETALIGSYFDYVGQRARWDEEQQGPFQVNWQQLATVAGISGAFGGAIQGVVPAVKAGMGFVRSVRDQARDARARGDVTLGMGVGPTDDAAARAAPQDDISEIGFYSAVRRAVDALPQDKGTAIQMRQMIAKGEGVKPEEMAWIGLDDFLKGRKNVTKQEIMDFVDANQVEVKEVVLGSGGETAKTRFDLESNRWVNPDGTPAAEMVTSNTQFDRYTLPGGENYREVALTLPERRGSGFDKKRYDELNKKDVAGKLRDPQEVEEFKRLMDESVANRRESGFTGGHLKVPNTLAHVRLNDRTGPNGEKILFVEEIQSDWHQKGRKRGYKTPDKMQRLAENTAAIDGLEVKYQNLSKDLDESHNVSGTITPDGNGVRLWTRDVIENNDYKNVGTVYRDGTYRIFDEDYAAKNPLIVAKIKEQAGINVELQRLREQTGLKPIVPDAPLKKTWHEMAFRRIARMAAEEGYDMIAWTPGKIQAARYDLSKQISEIHLSGTDFKAYDLRGNVVIEQTGVKADDLPELIGKEAADRLLAQEPEGTLRSLVGEELAVGGEGMEGFYDKMLKNYAGKFGKKFNAKVGVTKIARDYPEMADDQKLLDDLGVEATGSAHHEVWTLPVTKKMRDSLMQKGAPLFSAAPIAAAGLAGEERTE